jgi:YD repeat-containing protein
MRKAVYLFSLLFCLQASGQQLKLNFSPFTIASPNATSLGMFGVVPVSYSTGIPDISIPLYTLTEGNISVPIILKYHSAGFRPNQYPSWVGLGWTLQAGGMITRNVNGWPDEKDGQGNNIHLDEPAKFGYYFNTSLLAGDTWYYDKIKDAFTIDWDMQPDEFSFNINGISGKFYLDHNQQWQVYSDQDVKVICTLQDIKSINEDYYFKRKDPFLFGGLMFYKFILVLSDGTQYVFGGNRNSIEFTRPGSRNIKEIPTATTWNLTQIINPEGCNIISFEYERAENDLILCISRTFNILTYKFINSCDSRSSGGLQFSTYMLEPSYLKTITSNHQKIDFTSAKSDAMPLNIQGLKGIIDTSYAMNYGDIKWKTLNYRYYSVSDLSRIGRKLTKINIYYNIPGNSSLYKSFDFSYKENNSERLKITALKETAPNISNSASYKFEYYSSSLAEPDYETQKTDHWGFYNNWESMNIIGTNYQAFMNDQSKQDDYYIARNPSSNPDVYLIGMLKKISYPTGGTTTFEYEPHNYSEYLKRIPKLINGQIAGLQGMGVENISVIKQAGGLRIKRIISSPEDQGNNIVKEYFYIKDYKFNDDFNNIDTKLSSGQLQTELIQYPDQKCIDQYKICKPLRDNCINQCLKQHNNNNRQAEKCFQNCPQCTECMLYTISPYIRRGYYYHLTNNIGDFSLFSVTPFSPLSDKNGNHLVYGEVVEKMTNKGFTKFFYNLPASGSNQFIDELPRNTIGNDYYAELTSKINERGSLKSEMHFDETGKNIKEVQYYYNSNPNRFSRNIRTKPFNYHILPCNDVNASVGFGSANYFYIYTNYLEKKIETEYYSSGNLTKTTTYKYGGINDKLLVEESHDMSDGSLITTRYSWSTDFSLLPSYKNSNAAALFSLQQKHIIVPVETTVIQNKNNKTSILEGELVFYKSFSSNVVKPERILLFESREPLDATAFYPFKISSGIITYDIGHYKERMQFNNYDICGNLTEYRKTGDVATSIIYGYKNSFPVAKLINVTTNEILTVLSKSNLKLSDLNTQYMNRDDFIAMLNQLYALFPKAHIETYTYDVIKGITSITNENIQTTFYNYDNLGRLINQLDQDKNILKTIDYNFKH